MRIISGQFKSRHLKATPPPGTRPTSDKLRETLFNVLGETVRGCTFLDGCAGVGAIGIEAISRGAGLVVFVDQSRKATRMIRENLESLGIRDGFKIVESDLARALDGCARDGIVFDIAFVDPPYEREHIYKDALDKALLSEGGVLVMEHSRRVEMPKSARNVSQVRSLQQGDSVLAFYKPEVV